VTRGGGPDDDYEAADREAFERLRAREEELIPKLMRNGAFWPFTDWEDFRQERVEERRAKAEEQRQLAEAELREQRRLAEAKLLSLQIEKLERELREPTVAPPEQRKRRGAVPKPLPDGVRGKVLQLLRERLRLLDELGRTNLRGTGRQGLSLDAIREKYGLTKTQLTELRHEVGEP
jgi:hypothetical protein